MVVVRKFENLLVLLVVIRIFFGISRIFKVSLLVFNHDNNLYMILTSGLIN